MYITLYCIIVFCNTISLLHKYHCLFTLVLHKYYYIFIYLWCNTTVRYIHTRIYIYHVIQFCRNFNLSLSFEQDKTSTPKFVDAEMLLKTDHGSCFAIYIFPNLYLVLDQGQFTPDSLTNSYEHPLCRFREENANLITAAENCCL